MVRGGLWVRGGILSMLDCDGLSLSTRGKYLLLTRLCGVGVGRLQGKMKGEDTVLPDILAMCSSENVM